MSYKVAICLNVNQVLRFSMFFQLQYRWKCVYSILPGISLYQNREGIFYLSPVAKGRGQEIIKLLSVCLFVTFLHKT